MFTILAMDQGSHVLGLQYDAFRNLVKMRFIEVLILVHFNQTPLQGGAPVFLARLVHKYFWNGGYIYS